MAANVRDHLALAQLAAGLLHLCTVAAWHRCLFRVLLHAYACDSSTCPAVYLQVCIHV